MDNIGNIYKIKNLINNKEYIGCTIYPIKKRFEEHIWRCLNSDSNSKFCNSIRKYGVENFGIELVEECDVSVIYEREIIYINNFDTFHNGLNSTYGGEGCLGYKHSKEIKDKISKIIKDGRSHKGKTYEQIYGDKTEVEKQRRRESVKKSWDGLDNERRDNRIKKTTDSVRKNSKYGEDLIKEIKEKFKKGDSVNDLKNEYPQFNKSYLYSIKNNRRWKEL